MPQIFASCFSHLGRVVTFDPTFLSEEYLEKTVVLYFPSLDEGYTGGETLELVQEA